MRKRTVPILWYENKHGDRWYPPTPDYNGFPAPPEGFHYQHFRNPCELHDSICTDKGPIGAGTQTWNMTLVSHMTRPTLWTRLRQLWRCAWLPPLYELDAAILQAATSCERCMNVLHYRYATGDGYAYGSPEWLRCPTSCEYCDDDPLRPRRRLVDAAVSPAGWPEM